MYGLGALLMWAAEPLLVSEVERLPIFELLTIVFASSFVITAIRLTLTRRWHLIRNQSLLVILLGVIGVCGSDFAYIHAAQMAPIAHVDLIDYLWPCMAIFFAGFLPTEKHKKQHILGAMLGMCGIYILISSEGGQVAGIDLGYLPGYSLALFGAILWGGYSAMSRYCQKTPTEMIGIYCGLGAIISFVLHLKFETYVAPTSQECFAAIVTGVTGAGIAYQLWDYGVKFGNIYFLSIFTYAARSMGIVLLVLFGKEPFSQALVMACSLTILGVFISSMNINAFIKGIRAVINYLAPPPPAIEDEKEQQTIYP